MSPLNSLRTKTQHSGAHDRVSYDAGTLLGQRPDGVVYPIRTPLTPALLKAMDEILVNASDAVVDNAKLRGAANKTDEIRVTYCADPESTTYGCFLVWNNGRGIPIKVQPEAKSYFLNQWSFDPVTDRADPARAAAAKERLAAGGGEILVPEAVATIPNAGSNHDEKALDDVTGGVNGTGMKLAICHSANAYLQTNDGTAIFSQSYPYRLMEMPEPPTVVKKTAKKAWAQLEESQKIPHTMVRFTPAYEKLDMGGEDAGNGGLCVAEADANALEAWVRWRCQLLKSYLGDAVTIIYNDNEILAGSAGDIARAASGIHSFLGPWPREEAADAQVDDDGDGTASVVSTAASATSALPALPETEPYVVELEFGVETAKQSESRAKAASKTKKAKHRAGTTADGLDAADRAALRKLGPWRLAIAVLPPKPKGKKGTKGKEVEGDGAGPSDAAAAARLVALEDLRGVNIGVVNGIACPKGGHIKYIRTHIAAAVSAHPDFKEVVGREMTKAADRRALFANALVVFVGGVGAASFGSQTKDTLQAKDSLFRPYVPPAGSSSGSARKFRRAVAALTAGYLRDHGGAAGAKMKKKNPRANKYFPPSGRKVPDRILAVCEGDSAAQFLQDVRAAADKKSKEKKTTKAVAATLPTSRRLGIMSLGGTPVNPMKSTYSSWVEFEGRARPKEALFSCKNIPELVTVLGLEFGRVYTEADLARLPYSRVVIATDQDLDGTGNILPLVLVFFNWFWPELIPLGFIHVLVTPLVRVPSKTKGVPPLDFNYEPLFREWWESQSEEDRRAWKSPEYFKGLGGHLTSMKREFVTRFAGALRRIDAENELEFSAKLARLFGTDSEPRKKALRRPVVFPSADEFAAEDAMSAIDGDRLLEVDTLLFKKDVMGRQIPGVDGFLEGGRKILHVALIIFAAGKGNPKKKVFQFVGIVADIGFYHHGDKSAEGSVIQLARYGPGGREIPFLVGLGAFGGVVGKAAQARYISVQGANRILNSWFPVEDRNLYERRIVDGELAEPVYFVGVLPTVILESYSAPSQGWRMNSFARRFEDVLSLTRAYAGGAMPDGVADIIEDAITAQDLLAAADSVRNDAEEYLRTAEGGEVFTPAIPDNIRAAFPLTVALRHRMGGFGEDHRAKLVRNGVSYGLIEPGPGNDQISIVELPLGISLETYLKGLIGEQTRKRKPVPNWHLKFFKNGAASSVENLSGDGRVDIRITFAGSATETMAAISAWRAGQKPESRGPAEATDLEHFLGLWRRMNDDLNMITEDGGLLSFKGDYLAAALYWLPIRRRFLARRLDRREALLNLRLRLEQTVLAYLDAWKGKDGAPHRVPGGKIAKRAACAAGGWPRIDHALAARPGRASAEELRAAIEEADALEVNARCTYDYVYNISYRDEDPEAIEKRRAKADALEAELAETRAAISGEDGDVFPGAKEWLAELDSAEAAVHAGYASNWFQPSE